MRYGIRLALWLGSGVSALAADVVTKAAPHSLVIYHYAHTPAAVLVAVSAFLLAVGLWYSNMLAVGSGLMFGGLCGNSGQLLLYGYASDWIPVGGWLTNVADICGALGLLFCFAGYLARGAPLVRVR